jgi:hypothetical protein
MSEARSCGDHTRPREAFLVMRPEVWAGDLRKDSDVVSGLSEHCGQDGRLLEIE